MNIDQLTESKGFFKTFEEFHGELYRTLFDDSDSNDMDLTFSFAFGNFELLDRIEMILKVKTEVETVKFIVDYLVSGNSYFWQKLKISLNSLNPLSGEREERTSERTDTTKRNNIDIHDKNSFDDLTLSTDEKNTTDSTSGYTSDNHSVLDKTKDAIKSIEEYKKLTNQNKIFDIVAKDIFNFCGYAVY